MPTNDRDEPGTGDDGLLWGHWHRHSHCWRRACKALEVYDQRALAEVFIAIPDVWEARVIGCTADRIAAWRAERASAGRDTGGEGR
jgi:hypothetical protein